MPFSSTFSAEAPLFKNLSLGQKWSGGEGALIPRQSPSGSLDKVNDREGAARPSLPLDPGQSVLSRAGLVRVKMRRLPPLKITCVL